MKLGRAIWTLVVLLLLVASCMSGSSSPLTPGVDNENDARSAALTRTVGDLARAINSEDLSGLRDVFSPLYQLDGNLALRFFTTATTAENPSATTDEVLFLNDFFAQNENIHCELTVTNLTIFGTVATVSLDFLLSAMYIVEVPPMTYQAESSDVMVLAIEEGRWRLTSWQADPASEDPQTYEQQRVIAQITAFVEALNNEDLDTAESIVLPWLHMDTEVQRLFRTTDTLEPGSELTDNFREFFSTVFAQNQSIEVSLNPNPFYILGEQAEAGDKVFITAYFSLAAVYVGDAEAPAEQYAVENELQEMVFELVGGVWRLATWRKPSQPQPEATEETLREQIAALAAAVSSQDLGSIQGLASSLLGMNPSVALRFQTESTLADPPTPSADFAAFFSEVFAQNENIAVTMDVGTVNLNGTVADCEVGFSLAATYILGVPPDDYRFPEEGAVPDVMVWEFNGASWQLVTWQEAATE